MPSDECETPEGAAKHLADVDGNKNTAPQAYEGGYNAPGEVQTSPYLQRVWPDYASLTASGEFARLAEHLLRPLYTATFSAKAAAKAAEKGDAR